MIGPKGTFRSCRRALDSRKLRMAKAIIIIRFIINVNGILRFTCITYILGSTPNNPMWTYTCTVVGTTENGPELFPHVDLSRIRWEFQRSISFSDISIILCLHSFSECRSSFRHLCIRVVSCHVSCLYQGYVQHIRTD